MEGPHIKLGTEHEFSKNPEDNGFAHALKILTESQSSLAPIMEELNRSEEKKKIIDDSLVQCGRAWNDLISLSEPYNKEAAEFFGHMLAHWDTPLNGIPKTKEDHYAEALEFAKLLK